MTIHATSTRPEARAIEAGLRHRWAELGRQPQHVIDAVNAKRLVDVADTLELLDRAIAERWFGNRRTSPGTDADIRSDLLAGDGVDEIASRHGVSPRSVGRVRRNLAA